MTDRLPALGAALALAAVVALAGCGAGPSPTPAAPTSTPAPLPEASFTGGTASATLALPSTTQWKGGSCARGPGNAWLAVNIGFPNGAEYFGLVVGRSPYTPGATRSAAGGGTFGGADAVITWRHVSAATNVAGEGLLVEVEEDLSGGAFAGRLADGTEVRGEFAC